MAVKNITQWINSSRPSGGGYVTYIGFLNFQDNSGRLLTDNSLNNIVTNPIEYLGKFATQWTQTGV